MKIAFLDNQSVSPLDYPFILNIYLLIIYATPNISDGCIASILHSIRATFNVGSALLLT